MYTNRQLCITGMASMNKEHMFPKIMIVFVALATSFFENTIGGYIPYMVIGLMFFCFFYERVLPICVYLSATIFNAELGMMQYPALVMLVLSCLMAYNEKNKTTKDSKWAVFFFICVFVFASTYFGYRANINTAIITLICIFSLFCFYDIIDEKRAKLIEFSLVSSGVVMIAFVLYQIWGGAATYLWGTRLTYEESVRTLANALAVPVYYSFCKLTITNTGKMTLLSKFIYLVVFAAGVYVLFMTYSRGVLFSVGLACMAAILFTTKRNNIKHIITIFAVVVFAIIWIKSMNVNVDLLGHNITSGNGRTELWKYFIKDMFNEGIVRVVFGYGPGEFARVTQNSPFRGLYAHSLYMDALFSFGVVGFIYLLTQIFKIAKIALNSKKSYVIGLIFLTISMYITHGISSNYQFYLMLGLCYALSVIKR